MAEEPLTNTIYLTKEQIEWVKLAIHRDMIYQDETEPIEYKYQTMERLQYAENQFKFCKECWTHWVARWSDDKHTCSPKEEE